MLPAAPPASRPPNPPFIKSLRPPGWLPPKCLTAFQASNARIAIVIGDMPPPSVWEPGVLGPRGPCCMPLRTSSRPIVFLLARAAAPEGENIAVAHDGYKAQAVRHTLR